MHENQLYGRVIDYLNSLTSIEELDFTNLVTRKKPNEIFLQLDPNQTIEDDFIGAKVMWQIEGSGAGESRNLILKVRKADKRRILRPYLQRIHIVAVELEQKKLELKLYMNVDAPDRTWKPVPFTHPSTLETILFGSKLELWAQERGWPKRMPKGRVGLSPAKTQKVEKGFSDLNK
ncbi:AAA-ATPase At2g46620-like [Malus sylvestris]|uniref:AAA-ATPase At2g46620-like n=1 Tax=Malus sylvestris TaxID=3752 RepID=UPI0021ABBD76|nr:AAA-ATPase At2g46620-like [Malus sylvestris]